VRVGEDASGNCSRPAATTSSLGSSLGARRVVLVILFTSFVVVVGHRARALSARRRDAVALVDLDVRRRRLARGGARKISPFWIWSCRVRIRA
jgi:hypothetical protein